MSLQPGVHTHRVELVVTWQHPQNLTILVALQADGAAVRDGALHAGVRAVEVDVRPSLAVVLILSCL